MAPSSPRSGTPRSTDDPIGSDPIGSIELDPESLTLADFAALRKRVDGAKKIRKARRRQQVADAIQADLAEANARFTARRKAVPPLDQAGAYPDELPITARRDEICAAIRDHQVVVIAGETGSGKSTQLPKLGLEAGFGVRGTIGHTQPRRIAARSVAARVAEELGVEVGGLVGSTVRFDNRSSERTSIKVMTDGILLAELVRDPDLLAYDLIIVDEAHERSLNIDFLLGWLHRLVERRSDLHVVITSATIDTAKIASHFSTSAGPAPIIEVSGRTWPVEIRYRGRDASGDPGSRAGRGDQLDAPTAVREAIAELEAEGPGDVLVFSSGEREINEICEALNKHDRHLEVLPLYARLSNAEQQRVFAASKRRRVVVATNVAETSLTVPGIRFVVDLGEARVSRFSQRTKVQRLPIEPISQASANQRSGRCGRLGPGIAIRLYDEADFDARPEFTEPEIQRTNLASVILTMADQGLGSPLEFPFIDPPDPRAVTDGTRLLWELDAVTDPTTGGDRSWLTETGRTLARLPVDPRLARIVLAGTDEGCLHEAIVIAAALAIQDPRERPWDRRQAADEAHAAFADPSSDVLSLLHLWHGALAARRELNRRKFGRWCRDRFLHAQRMTEWFDTIDQLRSTCEDLGLAYSYSNTIDLEGGPPAESQPLAWGEDVHRAVLAGSLGQIGMRIERSHEYLGARNARFAIQPGSTCFDTKPDWIMATTLVETTRLWARGVAPIDPAWVEEPASHLTTIEVGEAEWHGPSGRALTAETVRLYGVPIVAGRPVPVARHDPELARAMFIDHALVEHSLGDPEAGEYAAHGQIADLLATNGSVRHEARNLVARSDRRTFDDEEQRVRAFYDQHLPADITDGARFATWYRTASVDDPHVLEMAVHDLLDPDELVVDETAFPDEVAHGDLTLTLDYHGQDRSLAVDVPVAAIGQIEPSSFLGVVPGHRRDAVIALVRAFPKPLRKRLVPVPETVDAVLAEVHDRDRATTAVDGSGAFALALRQAIERRVGEVLPVEALDPRSLPDGLRPHYRVVDDRGAVLAEGSDLVVLRRRLAADLERALDAGAEGITHPGATEWEFGDLPQTVTVPSRQGTNSAWPGLVDRHDRVGVDLFSDRRERQRSHFEGTRRLLRMTVAAPLREMNQVFEGPDGLARIQDLGLTPHAERAAWFEDLTLACLGTIIDDNGAVWNRAEFTTLQKRARARLSDLALSRAPVAASIIDETAAVRMAIVASDRLAPDQVADARHHLERLTFPGHLAAVGVERLDDVLRYVRGIRHRLDKLASRASADRSAMAQAQAVEAAYDSVASHLAWTPALEEVAWSLEELRVSLFAQHLGTSERVSPTRIRRRLEKLAAA